MRVLKERGLAMIEIMIGTLVIGSVLAFVIPILVAQQKTADAVALGANEQAFATAAQAYYVANSVAMLAAMEDGTGAAAQCVTKANPADGTGGTVLNDTTLHTCALDATWLQWTKALPMGFNPKSGRSSRWVAIFRAVYSAGVQTGDAEMLVVMAQDGASFDPAMLPAELSTAAGALGAGGGYLPGKDIGVCTNKRSTSTYQVCGVGGSWKTTLDLFITPAQLATFAAALPG